MATTYANAKTKIDEIAGRMATNEARITAARTNIDAAVTDLNQMSAAYSQLVTDIDAELAADPTNPAWQAIAAEKDLLVAEFATQRSTAESIQTAVNSV